MSLTTRWVTVVTLLCLVLCGCSPSLGQAPTPEPIILLPTPTGNAPARQTARPAATLTAPAAGTATAPATTVAGDVPTANVPANPGVTTTGSAAQNTITFAFDSFPSYFPGLIMQVKGLLTQRGYNLQLVPFGLNGANDWGEEERLAKLQSGEWDVLATTLDGFARRADPAIGAITAVIDESAGADKLVARPPIATLNDLAGKRIAFSSGSVSEYFAYYALSLAGLGPSDVILVPSPSVEDAVAAYTSGQADAVAAWEPTVGEAEQQGAQVLIASDRLRAILDVLVSGRPALTTKTVGLQAFHDAWFEALKLMIDQPAEAEQAIIGWGNPDWTAISAPGDLAASLQQLAQATLGANQIAFRSPDLLVSRVREAQGIWTRAGQAPPPADLAAVVDGRFVGVAAQNSALFSTQPLVNPSLSAHGAGRSPTAFSRRASGRAGNCTVAARKDRFSA